MTTAREEFDKRKAALLEPVGIQYTALTDAQKHVFLQLLNTSIRHYEFDFGKQFEKKIILSGLGTLSFAWAGSHTTGVPKYNHINEPM